MVSETLPRPAWGCRYECNGYWLICKCGAWNSRDYQKQNRCYMCSKRLLRDRTEVVDDIAKLESALVGLRAELETHPKTIDEVRNEMDKNTIDKKDWPPVRTPPPPPADLGQLATEGELVKLRTWLWKLRNTAKSALTAAQQEVDAYLRTLDPPAQKPTHKAGEDVETPEEEASMQMHAELHEKHPEMYEPPSKRELKHGVRVTSAVHWSGQCYMLHRAMDEGKYFNSVRGKWTPANESGTDIFSSEAHAIRFALRMGWEVLSTPSHYHNDSTRIPGQPGGLVQAYGACKCGGAVATGGTPYEDIWRQHMEEVSAPTLVFSDGCKTAAGREAYSNGMADDKRRQRSLAQLKGASAFAHGFPTTTEHGYAGDNVIAWKYGYEYCRYYMGGRYPANLDMERLWSERHGQTTACTKEGAFAFAQSYAMYASDKLLKFKQYVHDRLDKAGVPKHEEQNAINGCRIGARLDCVLRPPLGFLCHAGYCGATGSSGRLQWRDSDMYLCTCGLANYMKARREGA